MSYLIIVFIFVAQKEHKLICKNIEVEVVDSVQNAFVDSKEILILVDHNYKGIVGQPLDSIDKERLEIIIDRNPSVKNAEVYSTLTGKLRVEVKQRKPILRVMGQKKGYYIDEQGRVMPLASKFTSRVLVASGAITKSLAQGELLELARFISEDEFWHSLIDQIYVTSKKEYILVPRVGSQKIVLGSLENYRYKFRKLLALYRDGFSRSGWNKYSKIDLKYKNQVVCTKR